MLYRLPGDFLQPAGKFRVEFDQRLAAAAEFGRQPDGALLKQRRVEHAGGQVRSGRVRVAAVVTVQNQLNVGRQRVLPRHADGGHLGVELLGDAKVSRIEFFLHRGDVPSCPGQEEDGLGALLVDFGVQLSAKTVH